MRRYLVTRSTINVKLDHVGVRISIAQISIMISAAVILLMHTNYCSQLGGELYKNKVNI